MGAISELFSDDFMIIFRNFSSIDFGLTLFKHFNEFWSERGAQMDRQIVQKSTPNRKAYKGKMDPRNLTNDVQNRKHGS